MWASLRGSPEADRELERKHRKRVRKRKRHRDKLLSIAPPPSSSTFFPSQSLTVLQSGHSLRLFAEDTVPDIVGGQHPELVRREGLQPTDKTH